ncbi:MAG: hypothetical protein KDB07_03465, partial [Planctomycetes bacterium]|nr:hypothetical protein [Planctomycetota bacterium]
MKTLILSAALALVLGSACTSESDKTESTPSPDNTEQSARKKTDPTVEALSKTGWAYLESRYNAADEEAKQGNSWGPKADTVLTAFVLLGGLQTGVINIDDKRVEE